MNSVDRSTEILGNYDQFLSDIISRIQNEGFDMADFSQIDHMCYRTTSEDNYHLKITEITEIARLIGTNQVNGREISVFRLNTPVTHDNWRIDFIELPAPKNGKPFEEGLEHIELILFDDIPSFLAKYKDKEFELRAVDRGINPEIGLQLGNYSVKFHLLSLGTVVYLEHKLGITEVADEK